MERSYHSRMHCKWKSWLQLVTWSNKNEQKQTIRTCHNIKKKWNIKGYKRLVWINTVEGSLLQNGSRQMLQLSSHASWVPPSTKAIGDECWFSIFSISNSLLSNLNLRLVIWETPKNLTIVCSNISILQLRPT